MPHRPRGREVYLQTKAHCLFYSFLSWEHFIPAAPCYRMGALCCQAHSHGSFGTVNLPTDTHSACGYRPRVARCTCKRRRIACFVQFSHGSILSRQHPAAGWEHFSAKPIAMGALVLSTHPPTPILPVKTPHRVARCTCKRRRTACFVHFPTGAFYPGSTLLPDGSTCP
jgi:hypothetical protein